MKILFVLEFFYPHIGGVEVLFKHLCHGLVRKGIKVTVVTLLLPGTKKHEIIDGIEIYRIGGKFTQSRYWFTFISIPHVLRLARSVDLIHTTTYNGAFPAFLAAKILRKPVSITVHEVLGKKWSDFTAMSKINGFLHRAMEFMVINLSYDLIVAVSNSTKRSLKKNNVRVIYNGIDYELFNPAQHDELWIKKELKLDKKFLYMFYGRPGVSKGLEYLVKAVPEITQHVPDSKLLMILSKDRTYKERYEYIINLLKKQNIQSHVKIIDPVPRQELPAYIKAADCVVVPSLCEGFGFTAAEACAMGTPVVASDTTSLPEVVSGRYVLIPPRRSHEIARAVGMIANNQVENRGKKTFYWQDTIDQYYNAFQNL
jgi:glycosyltransferase involved in cell wall biosynthesis